MSALSKQKALTLLTDHPFDSAPCKKGDTVRIVENVMRITETVGEVVEVGRYYSGDAWIAVKLGKEVYRFWSDEIAEVIAV